MAVAGDLPDRRRMQKIGDQPSGRSAEPAQQAGHGQDGAGFEQDHRKLHRPDARGDQRHNRKDRLGHGRIDRHRVVALIDQKKLIGIAEGGQRRIGRDVQVGVEAGIDDAAVPYIAVDIARQRRSLEHEREAKQRRAHDKDREDASAAADRQPGAEDGERGLGQCAAVEKKVACRAPKDHPPGQRKGENQDRGGGWDVAGLTFQVRELDAWSAPPRL